jgi:hypothetical protein
LAWIGILTLFGSIKFCAILAVAEWELRNDRKS